MQYHREEELKNRLNNFFITKFSLPEDDYYSRLDSEKIISLAEIQLVNMNRNGFQFLKKMMIPKTIGILKLKSDEQREQ